jgi:hypothetical protein
MSSVLIAKQGYELLNKILDQLNKHTQETPLPKEHILWYADSLFDSSSRDRFAIMRKLVKDGYADFKKIEITEEAYFITFEGILFLDNGGYPKQQKLIRKKERNQRWRNRITTIGSILATGYVIVRAFFYLLHVLYPASPVQSIAH